MDQKGIHEPSDPDLVSQEIGVKCEAVKMRNRELGIAYTVRFTKKGLHEPTDPDLVSQEIGVKCETVKMGNRELGIAYAVRCTKKGYMNRLIQT